MAERVNCPQCGATHLGCSTAGYFCYGCGWRERPTVPSASPPRQLSLRDTVQATVTALKTCPDWMESLAQDEWGPEQLSVLTQLENLIASNEDRLVRNVQSLAGSSSGGPAPEPPTSAGRGPDVAKGGLIPVESAGTVPESQAVALSSTPMGTSGEPASASPSPDETAARSDALMRIAAMVGALDGDGMCTLDEIENGVARLVSQVGALRDALRAIDQVLTLGGNGVAKTVHHLARKAIAEIQ